jgi:3-hydroxybutyryl-CoA dehydratase
MVPQARILGYDDLHVGMVAEENYLISSKIYEGFLSTFEDYSPIHIDENEAHERGFAGRVMHGAILNGFLSHFVGMTLPGAESLLLSADIRYLSPSYLGDKIRLRGEIMQKLDTHRVIVLNAQFTNLTRDVLAASGRVQVKIRQ